MSDVKSENAIGPNETKPAPRKSASSMLLNWVLPLQLVVFLAGLVWVWSELPSGEEVAKSVTNSGAMSVNAEAGGTAASVEPEAVTPGEGGLPKGTEEGASRVAARATGIADFLKDEVGIFLLVMLAGAIGGAVHALNSYVNYVGQRSYVSSWMVWYLFRAPIGAGLALMVYVALRSGLMSGAADVNPIGFVAVGLLTGMFNKEALTKLKGVAVALFASAKSQSDSLADDTTLELLSVAPVEIPAGTAASITLTGKNFNAHTVAVVGGHDLSPSTSTPTSLEVLIPAAHLAAGQELPVWVAPAEGGSRSKTQCLIKVKAASSAG